MCAKTSQDVADAAAKEQAMREAAIAQRKTDNAFADIKSIKVTVEEMQEEIAHIRGLLDTLVQRNM